MNRRAFVKWLFSLIVVIGGVFFGLVKWLYKADSESIKPSVLSPASPVNPPKPEPTSQQKGGSGSGSLLLSVFILTDPHISEELPQHTNRLKAALKQINQFSGPVEGLMFTGDVTDFGRDSDYKLFQKIVGGFKLPPIHANMGNHDYYNIWLDRSGAFNREGMPNGKTDAQSRERFQKYFGLEHPYYDVWLNGVHFIFLSQETYVQEKPDVGEGAWYSDAQLAFLKEKLAAHKDGSPVFVMIHQPLPPAGQDGGTHRLIRGKAFREILRPYANVFVFSGHTHLAIGKNSYNKDRFHWFHNSSVTRVRANSNSDLGLSQGYYVQVYENEVVLRGREFSNQTWLKDAEWRIPLQRAKT